MVTVKPSTKTRTRVKPKSTELASPENGAADTILLSEPYAVEVKIEGTAAMLFHRWNCEAIEEKARAKKGSAAKKTDDLESYVWRRPDRMLCLPGEYLRMATVNAAKYKQDPRSPRKSAMDLYKAGVIVLTELAPLGTTRWDYEDKRRVVIQRNGINRVRPAFKPGWKATFVLQIGLPEYIGEIELRDTIEKAGKFVGVGDFRPTYGRFDIVEWKLLKR